MKNLMLVILAAAMGAAVSAWWNQHAAVTKMITETSAEKKPLYWVAPMDPNFRRDEPGLSPMGMELVPVYEEADNSSPGTVTISPAVEAQMGVTT
ncbi:MAG: heavy metal-binding domain-containing protein, partial [Pseudomonadota bacterium]